MKKFLIKTVASGYVFHLVAANNETIGTSEVYTTVAACKDGIKSVKNNAGSEVEDQTKKDFTTLKFPKYEVYNAKDGKPRFRLMAHNGQEILASQSYTSKEACLHGIESVKNNAPTAEIVMEENEVKG